MKIFIYPIILCIGIYLWIFVKNPNSNIIDKLPHNYFDLLNDIKEPIFNFSEENIEILINEVDKLNIEYTLLYNNNLDIIRSINTLNSQINNNKDIIAKLHNEIDTLKSQLLS